jgi:NhaC family Na+:H+ antiporter
MMSSIALTMIAMMFGGIMEETGQLRVIVEKLMGLVRGPVGLVAMTEITCVLSNATMPEQYISIVVPGRMYAGAYDKMGLHPKTLSNALEGAGTVTSALIPWNTCGTYIYSVLGISALGASGYFPYAVFNWLMPLVVIVMAFTGHTLANAKGERITTAERKAEMKKNVEAFNKERLAEMAAAAAE